MKTLTKQEYQRQWYGCGLTNKEAIIHVHHIFPRKEYPELASVEQYMICYCWEHHNLWHKKRRDVVKHIAEMEIKPLVKHY